MQKFNKIRLEVFKNIKKGINPIIVINLLSIIFFGCAQIPGNIGKARAIVVVSSKVDTSLIENNLQIYNYLPQKEPLFSFLFVPDTLFKNYEHYHTVFLYGSLKDDFIQIMLNPEARKATEKDTFTLFKLTDLWAKGQLVFILAVSEPQFIAAGISKYRRALKKLFQDNYYERIKQNYYARGMDRKIKARLRRFHIDFDLTNEWMIDSTYKKEGFISIHAHFPDRSIFFYKEKLSNPLNDSFAIYKRDSLTKKYYQGDYILKESTRSYSIEFKNMKGIELKGIWQNDSLVAGGPFISYFLTDQKTLYIIDAMLFLPGERKTDYFTKLEVILNSFVLAP